MLRMQTIVALLLLLVIGTAMVSGCTDTRCTAPNYCQQKDIRTITVIDKKVIGNQYYIYDQNGNLWKINTYGSGETDTFFWCNLKICQSYNFEVESNNFGISWIRGFPQPCETTCNQCTPCNTCTPKPSCNCGGY